MAIPFCAVSGPFGEHVATALSITPGPRGSNAADGGHDVHRMNPATLTGPVTDQQRRGRRPAARIVRLLAIGALALAAFALLFPPLYVLVRPLPVGAPVSLPVTAEGTYDVYVADWGYHTSVLLPQAPQWALGPPGRERAAYVEYAWGDRRFYRDSDYRLHSLFATLVLPTESVTYIAGRDRPPLHADGARTILRRRVDAATLHALAVELERSVRRDASGARTEASDPVPGYAGRFHDAYGSYLWTYDCNRWTVDRLAAAGLARSGGGFVVFSGQVAGRLDGFRVVRAPAGR